MKILVALFLFTYTIVFADNNDLQNIQGSLLSVADTSTSPAQDTLVTPMNLLPVKDTAVCESHEKPFDKGCVEIAMIGTAGYYKRSNSSGMYMTPAFGYAFLNLTVGYYIVKGFSIEPQYGMLAEENFPPSHSLLFNISYTAQLPESKLALFARVGYGIGNSLSFPMYGNLQMYSRDQWDINIINAGAGIKFLCSDHVALRVELNYRMEQFSNDIVYNSYYGYGYYSSPSYEKTDFEYTSVSALFGFSVLL